ncbi:hypothetical protein B0H14DRAFT_3430668 [Mycena olivaceomarginata]|nr:hypothetical protein B0H14DRAFT_3430668 [Mycena olivaceomarginata]
MRCVDKMFMTMPALRLGFLVFSILVAVQARVAVSPTSKSSLPASLICSDQSSQSRLSGKHPIPSSARTSPSVTPPNTFNPTVINGTFDPIYTFPNATGLTGIPEYCPGVFAVVTSILDLTTRRWAPGSIVIWSVDFNAPTPAVRALAALESAEGGNGITTQVDTRTGKSRVAIQDASMLPGAPAPALGINGLHQQIFAVPLAVRGGNVSGVGFMETLAAVEPVGEDRGPDDFALDCEGHARVTVHPSAFSASEQTGQLDAGYGGG